VNETMSAEAISNAEIVNGSFFIFKTPSERIMINQTSRDYPVLLNRFSYFL